MRHFGRRLVRRFRRSAVISRIKIAALILLLSLAAGKLALVISEAIRPSPARLSAKERVINHYKQKYGDDWKKKALEDYKKYKK